MVDIKSLGLMPEAEFAEMRRCKTKALVNERARGDGPPHTKIGKRVYYPIKELRAYIKAATVTPSKPKTQAKAVTQRKAVKSGTATAAT